MIKFPSSHISEKDKKILFSFDRKDKRNIERKIIKENKKLKDLVGWEAFKKWMADEKNLKTMYNSGDVAGRFIENRIIETEGYNTIVKENQNTHFYDILRMINNMLQKGEIKSTSTLVTDESMKKHNTSYLKIGGFKQKKGEFHVMIIIDKVNFQRFEIPHDVFFNEFKFSGTKENDFRWYADYDEYKTLQKVKRNLLPDGTYRLRSETKQPPRFERVLQCVTK